MARRRGKRLAKPKRAKVSRKPSTGPLGYQHTCYVYHIKVRDQWYVGFTSRPVPQRIHEHIENSIENELDTRFYRKLRINSHQIDGLWYEEYPNEWAALRAEQLEIQKLGGPKTINCLNSTWGGEGTNIVLNRKGQPSPRKKSKWEVQMTTTPGTPGALDETRPAGTDSPRDGDNQIRQTKAAAKAGWNAMTDATGVTHEPIYGTQFTADTGGSYSIGNVSIDVADFNLINGITATATEINYTDGVTSNIQTQLNTKAPLASPALTGTPTAPTASANTNNTQLATTAYVDRAATAAESGSTLASQGVTATAAELNTLDGITSSTAELNTLDGYTGNSADLNYAAGLRATGVTTTEFDYLDGVTSNIQTQLNAIDKSVPAITSNGSTPSLNSGISGAEVRSAIGAGTSSFDGNYNSLSNRPLIPSAANNATITLSAGTGLSGGGNFTTNQSSNETITFNLDGAPVAAYNSVGSYAFGAFEGAGVTQGSSYAGSSIRIAGLVRNVTSTNDGAAQVLVGFGSARLSGTWRAMGRVQNSGANSRARITLFHRIS